MNKSIIFSCLVLFAISCVFPGCLHYFSPSKKFKNTVGKEIYSILSSPESVKMEGNSLFSESEMRTLQKFLLEDKSYVFDRTKKCLFVPEVTLVFESEKEQVVVFLSFFSKQVKFFKGDRTIILDSDPMDEELKEFIFKERE